MVLSAASEATGGVGETMVFIHVYGEKPDSGGFKEGKKKRRQKPANSRSFFLECTKRGLGRNRTAIYTQCDFPPQMRVNKSRFLSTILYSILKYA